MTTSHIRGGRTPICGQPLIANNVDDDLAFWAFTTLPAFASKYSSAFNSFNITINSCRSVYCRSVLCKMDGCLKIFYYKYFFEIFNTVVTEPNKS